MTIYEAQTLETAPEKSREAMLRLKNSAGMIPNLAAMMSTSPTLIDAFVTLREIYSAGTLDAREREALGLANAVENGCEWCVAFHSFVALKLGVDEETVRRLRSGGDPDDPRLRALTRLTRRLIRNRGKIEAADLDAFVAAGFGKDQALEVVAGLAVSTHGKLRRQLRRSRTGRGDPQPALVARQLVQTNLTSRLVPLRKQMPSAQAEVRKAILRESRAGDVACSLMLYDPLT